MGALADVRARVAAALDVVPDEWTIHAAPVDALEPPAIMLTWSDPWTVPGTYCAVVARLVLVLVAGRIDPDPGIETLEAMVEECSAVLARAGMPAAASGPGPFEIGGIRYLAARLTLSVPVTLGGT